MDMFVLALVLAAAAMHATWNALVKAGGDALTRLALTNGFAALSVSPLLLFVGVPAAASWPYLGASVIVHGFYYGFLVLSYRSGDLSLAYPIARGSAPPLVAVGAFVIAGETLTPLGLAAVALICTAIAGIALRTPRDHRGGRTVVFAMCTGLAIAGYTVMDGMGARVSGDTLGYITYMFLLDGLPLVLFVGALRGRRFLADARMHWRAGSASGALAVGAYGLVIWAMTQTPMSYVSALRETSVVFAALIGSHMFREPFGGQRVGAACLVAAGVVLLQLSRPA